MCGSGGKSVYIIMICRFVEAKIFVVDGILTFVLFDEKTYIVDCTSCFHVVHCGFRNVV